MNKKSFRLLLLKLSILGISWGILTTPSITHATLYTNIEYLVKALRESNIEINDSCFFERKSKKKFNAIKRAAHEMVTAVENNDIPKIIKIGQDPLAKVALFIMSNNSQWNLLHIAIAQQNIPTIQALLNIGCDIHLPDFTASKTTPLDAARTTGNKEIINLLEAHATTNPALNNGLFEKFYKEMIYQKKSAKERKNNQRAKERTEKNDQLAHQAAEKEIHARRYAHETAEAHAQTIYKSIVEKHNAETEKACSSMVNLFFTPEKIAAERQEMLRYNQALAQEAATKAYAQMHTQVLTEQLALVEQQLAMQNKITPVSKQSTHAAHPFNEEESKEAATNYVLSQLLSPQHTTAATEDSETDIDDGNYPKLLLTIAHHSGGSSAAAATATHMPDADADTKEAAESVNATSLPDDQNFDVQAALLLSCMTHNSNNAACAATATNNSDTEADTDSDDNRCLADVYGLRSVSQVSNSKAKASAQASSSSSSRKRHYKGTKSSKQADDEATQKKQRP